jgi:streptomycin 6-kinase
LSSIQQKWRLKLGEPFQSTAAWVVPAEQEDGSLAVLKIGIPHMEARDEARGLLFWDGDAAVRVLRHDPETNAMLLERCMPGNPLREQPEQEQDVVIAGLLRRLWNKKPGPELGFRHLSDMTKYWADEVKSSPVEDPGLLAAGLQLFDELTPKSESDVLLATDLHAGDVLSATREPWLVTDPKPFIGDPAYDATQHLFNCEQRLHADPHELIRRFAGLLGVDPERVRLWLFARAAAEPDTRHTFTSLARKLQV